MRVAFVLLAIVCVASGRTLWHQLDQNYTFDKYCAEHGRDYAKGSEEYLTRSALFTANLQRILAHNADPTKTWKEGVNRFTDRTEAEMKQLLGYKKSLGYARRAANNVPSSLSSEDAAAMIAALPTSVDWREKGAVTPVKDQGQCGSCWTFGSTETLESAYFLSTGILQELSEQQVASCTYNPLHCGGSGGCEGGTSEVAFASILAVGGIASEWTYPYLSYNGSDYTCKINAKTTFAASIKQYTTLPSNEAAPFMDALANIGPIAITVDASEWFKYEEGVFNGCNQTSPDLDHNVQAVGYGTDPKLGNYWLVRNSWSAQWGEKGYIRVAREDPTNPPCGMDTKPSDGSGCDNGPSEVKVCGTCGILYDNVYLTI